MKRGQRISGRYELTGVLGRGDRGLQAIHDVESRAKAIENPSRQPHTARILKGDQFGPR